MTTQHAITPRARRTSPRAAINSAICLLLAAALHPAAAGAASLPSGFTETRIATGLIRPTTMDFAPDGRLFVSQQGGDLRVIKDGVLLDQPFLSVTTDSNGERGLLGVTFDPDFATNHWVYIYYTALTPATHNRLSRFTADGDRAVPGSEVVLLDLPNLSSARNHNGGSLHFGPDGKLYVAVGENANGPNSQRLDTVLGKILRLSRDGTPPADNPFFGVTTGANRSIWAMGLRNPFTFAFQPGSGRMFINDVGQDTWEEINEGVAGANYGWPQSEGPTSNPAFRTPLFSYTHGFSPTQGCAITGGAFYNPAQQQFPAEYRGNYFFADFCGGWIHRLDPAHNNAVLSFATGASMPVDLEVTDDGSLYYLDRGSGSVFRIHATASQAPSITVQPEDTTVSVGEPASFTVAASGVGPLRYRWQRNGADIPGATAATYTLPAAGAADDGAVFRVIVSNDFGSATSDGATLRVTANRRPTATITSPANGTLYRGGETFTFSGTGTDPEQGELPAGAFSWRIDFHHDTHTHPFLPPTTGVKSGSFTIPARGETSANVFYRVTLTVRDAAGLTHTATADVVPRKATLTLATDPAGLRVTLDGQPLTAPASVVGVAGIVRRLAAPSPQTFGGISYVFDSWSDGGAADHEISTPDASTTYTAVFRAGSGTGRGIGLAGAYFANPDLLGQPVWTRVDPGVAFTWRRAPAPGAPADHFSVRWTGQVEARVSGLHTFTTITDDGVRLWVDGELLIDDWHGHPAKENQGGVVLQAGQRYDLRMEFFDDVAGAQAQLLWSAPGLARQVIPASQLFPYALLLTGGAKPAAGDLALQARLAAAGYAPLLRRAPGLPVSDLADKAVIVVSASAPTWALGPRLRAASEAPLVVCGSRNFAALGLTGEQAGVDFGIRERQTQLAVEAPDELPGGGPAGPRQVTSEPTTFSWGQPGREAHIIARLCERAHCQEGAQPALFLYPAGAALPVGFSAPNRRVGLFAGIPTPALFTADGWALFDAAVRWASGR